MTHILIHPFFHLSNNYLLRPCDVFPSVMLGNESERWSLPSWTWSVTEKQQATFIKYSKWSKGWCWWERDHAAKKASCIRRYPHPISMVNTKETRRETERKVVHGNIKVQELTEITQVCHILVGSLQCGPSACLPLLMALCGFPLNQFGPMVNTVKRNWQACRSFSVPLDPVLLGGRHDTVWVCYQHFRQHINHGAEYCEH